MIKKKNILRIKVVALAVLLSTSMNAQAPKGGSLDAKAFKNPPNEFRITQYNLTPKTLQQFPEYGIGGVMGFFYSILYPESNKKRYKTNDPAAIGKLVDAANDIDYKVWLADDWGYPSGMAGGRVVAENPEWEVKSLTMLKVAGEGDNTINYAIKDDLYDIVYASIYPVENGKVNLNAGKKISIEKRNITTKGIEGDWEMRVFARYVRDKAVQAQSTIKQFGHTGHYPDIMNREAVARFIANMHQPILAEIDDPASKVEGFYANEPNLMQTHWRKQPNAPYACTPWSEVLPEVFQKMHGYDLFSVLSHLYEGDSDTARRTRIHYRQAVSELLTDSFSKQIREWCNARGIQSSGHFLLNDYLSMHVQGYGDMMKFVSEFDIPALDIPIPNPDQFMDFSYQQSRFFSSVTSWKKRDKTIMLLDPIIGGYGRSRLSPDLPLLLNSVNMASFHGVNKFTSYMPLKPVNTGSVNGHQTRAKGYTPEEYRFFNEYTGRISKVMQGAQREAGVGLYYPIAMFQADLLASNQFWTKIRALHEEKQQAWNHTEETLLKGDVEYMIVHPEGVQQGDINNGTIQIGYGNYHTLVIPQMKFIPLDVLKKLQEFEASGGTIYWVTDVPSLAEHKKNDAAIQQILKDVKPAATEDLVKEITNSYSAEFDLDINPDTSKLTVGRFYKGDEQIYLLINRTQEPISVSIKGQRKNKIKKALQLLDPSTGKIKEIKASETLKMEANRAMIIVPKRDYLNQKLKK